MTIEQVSVFIENKTGCLVEILQLLGKEKIDLRAYSVAEKTEFGILRMLVDRPDEAVACLKSQGFRAKKTEILAIGIPDEPGGSVRVFEVLSGACINLDYTYAFAIPKTGRAVLLVRVSDNDLAQKALAEAGIETVGPEALQ